MSSEPEKTCHLCKYRNIPEGAEPCAECLSEGEEDKWEPGEPAPDLPALLVRYRVALEAIGKQWIGDQIDKDQLGGEPDYQAGYEGCVRVAREALLADLAKAGVK